MATFNKILLQLQQIDKTKDPEQRQQQIQALKHDVDVSENLKNKETVQRLIENILSQPKESSEQPIQLPEELGELRNIFEAYLKSLGPEKGKPILNTYATLLSYAKLAWEFESHNGIPEEHALKLSILFGNPKHALGYLVEFTKHNPTQQTIHNGCLFSVPQSTNNIDTWRRMATADNYSAMFKADFKQFLTFSTELEAYLKNQKRNKKEINERLKEDIKKRAGAFADFEFNGDQDDPQLLTQAEEHLSKKITALNKICKEYETNIPTGIRDRIGHDKYQQSLEERAQLRAKRTEFYAERSFQQFSLTMLQDIYIAHDLQKPNGLLSYFRKNNIPPAKYEQFLTLDRSQAGIYIPDISINGQSIGLPGYYLRKINVQNEAEAARAACLGELTNSCQSLSGETGEPCAIHGLTNPQGGFYIVCQGDIRDPNALDHPILAQSWAWVNQSHQTLVLDSVEYPTDPNPQQQKTNMRIVKSFYEALATELANSHDLNRVMIGTDGQTPADFGYNFKDMLPLAGIPETPEGYTGYRDSKKQRVFGLRGFPLANIMACVGKSPIPYQENTVKEYFASLQNLQDNVPLKQWMCWYVNQDSDTSDLERLTAFKSKYIPKNLEPEFNNIVTAIGQIQAECQKRVNEINYLKLRQWASEGYSINFRDRNNQTIAMRATMENSPQALQALLENQIIAINQPDEEGDSVIYYAIQNQQAGIVRFLLENPNLNLNQRNNSEQTPLMHVFTRGDAAVINSFLAHDPTINLNSINHLGETPLMQAVQARNKEIVQFLLEKTVEHGLHRSETFLTDVLQTNDLDIILMVLDCPNVNLEELETFHGEQEAWVNAILYAIDSGHSEIINHVLSRNVNFLHINKAKYWHLILHSAVSENRFDSIKLILDKLKEKVELSSSATSQAYEKLHQALLNNILTGQKVGAVDALFKLKIFDIDRKQSLQFFQKASFFCRNNLKMFEALAQYSPNALATKDPEDWFDTIRNCSPEVVKLLIDKKILSVNQMVGQNASKAFKTVPEPIIFKILFHETLTNAAVRTKVQLFLQHPELDLNIRNSEQKTPLEYAVFYNKSLETIHAILQHPNLDLSANNQGERVLVEALKSHNTTVIRALQPYANKLGNLSDICAKYPNAFFFHFLIRAIDEKETPFLEAVLNWPNLDVNPIENVRHHTPLTYAIEKNATQHIDLLLNHRTIDINKPNGLGITPLEMAIRNGNVPLVTQLLRNPKIILDIPLRPQEEQSSKTLLESVREFAATERNIALDEALAMRAPSLQPNKLLKFSQDNSSSSPAADPDPKNPPSTPKKGSSS